MESKSPQGDFISIIIQGQGYCPKGKETRY